jgi:hypothetical protein
MALNGSKLSAYCCLLQFEDVGNWHTTIRRSLLVDDVDGNIPGAEPREISL